MSEGVLEKAFERAAVEQVVFAAEVVKAATEPLVKKNEKTEEDGILTFIVKTELNKLSRRAVSRFGPPRLRNRVFC